MKTIILGAGFTGLAAGIKTGSPIYEASDHAGGICRSYVKDGFTFSTGGPHYLFGQNKGLDYIKTLVEVKEYERKAGEFIHKIFPYPFQSNFPEFAMYSPKRQVLKEWLVDSFGSDQCHMFFHPFNDKYTAGLYDQIIQTDDFKSPPAGGKGFCSTFGEPVGGLSNLVDKMASKCDIKYNMKARAIDTDIKTMLIGQDTVIKYDKLISTIPLNKLMEICGQKVNLPYTSVLVINIGAEKGVNFPKEHWLYIPFCKSGFHRVAFYTNVDKSKAPFKTGTGLSVEIAFKGDDPREESPFIVRNVIQELKKWGWIGKVRTWAVDVVPCAYTWQYNKEDVPNALQWLKERDIISTGRYGKWKFQGMTQSIEDGLNV